MHIREMTLSDHPRLLELFKSTPGITLREADSKEATARYLSRNPGLSFVAEDRNVAEDRAEIIGCVMSGHDGRRGYLQHLIVAPKARNQGTGEKLYQQCITALAEIGIDKTHIFVFKDNELANEFWAAKGWTLRTDINQYSLTSSENKNA